VKAAAILLGFAVGITAGFGVDMKPFVQVALAVVGVYLLLWAVDWLNEQEPSE
jgi:uncharacterized membrane protein (Fun14 family)